MISPSLLWPQGPRVPCAWHVGGGGNTLAKGRRGHLGLLLENGVPGGPPAWDLTTSLGPQRGRVQTGREVGFMIAASAAAAVGSGSIQVRGQGPPPHTPYPPVFPLMTPPGSRQILEPSSSLCTVHSPSRRHQTSSRPSVSPMWLPGRPASSCVGYESLLPNTTGARAPGCGLQGAPTAGAHPQPAAGHICPRWVLW